jgi:hypothetical protein
MDVMMRSLPIDAIPYYSELSLDLVALVSSWAGVHLFSAGVGCNPAKEQEVLVDYY